MPSSPDQLVNAETRHAVYVNRFAGGLHHEFLPYLEDLEADLIKRLSKEGTDFQQTRLSTLLMDIREIQAEIYAEYQGDLFGQLEDFSHHEGEFEQEALIKVADHGFSRPSDVQLWATVKANPLTFEDSQQVKLLNPFIKDWTKSEVQKVEQIVRFGFSQGQTVAEMTSAVTDSLNKGTVKNNRAIVRTATNHVSTVAREKTMEDNDDILIGYKIVATLDSRTSNICKGYDGVEVKRTDKRQPKPPFHPNCRTTTVALFDDRFNFDDSSNKRGAAGVERGQVNADQTYYKWLKSEGSKGPKGRAFVEDVLGKERADLFLNGGLSAERFKKLTTDEHFQPLPLKELRKKKSLQLAFDKIDNNS